MKANARKKLKADFFMPHGKEWNVGHRVWVASRSTNAKHFPEAEVSPKWEGLENSAAKTWIKEAPAERLRRPFVLVLMLTIALMADHTQIQCHNTELPTFNDISI
ncbi:MAG TPA: hypothetical protein VFF11_06540 [Candidatus Binatia bacterium]|nr:hypothetical protein [Candidatus Binatia bacterium]